MSPIIAGRFEQSSQAEAAEAALRKRGFGADDIVVFFVNPPGQHGTFPIGGDRDESPGAKHAEGGAMGGVAVGSAVGVGVGILSAPLLGPGAVVAGAAAGAYAGSLMGALGDMEGKPAATPGKESIEPSISDAPARAPTVRLGGVLVAVRATEFDKRVDAVNVLRAEGARDIERADGTLSDGRWTDFDPLKPLVLVDLPASEDAAQRMQAD